MAPKKDESRKLYEQLDAEAKEGGYILNPDEAFVMDLMDGLVKNRERYGYIACPCRDADGEREKDLDIICPCDYRDPDLDEFGTCYCALYVSQEVAEGKKKLGPIPERRPPTGRPIPEKTGGGSLRSTETIWKCNVCGYLAARPEPPLKCPVCKADKDRFSQLASETIWKCNVCGYLAARPEPPLKCPVCKADKDRFSQL